MQQGKKVSEYIFSIEIIIVVVKIFWVLKYVVKILQVPIKIKGGMKKHFECEIINVNRYCLIWCAKLQNWS